MSCQGGFVLTKLREFEMKPSFKYDMRNRIGAQLKKVRLDKNMTAEEVVLQTDISLMTLNGIENGGSVAWSKYQKLMKFYKIDWQIVLVERE